jgi:hypothetical protein
MQAKDIDGIGASRPGSPPLVSCAATRDQPHRQAAMGPCGMPDRRSTGTTAIKEDPVAGISTMSAHRGRPPCVTKEAGCRARLAAVFLAQIAGQEAQAGPGGPAGGGGGKVRSVPTPVLEPVLRGPRPPPSAVRRRLSLVRKPPR